MPIRTKRYTLNVFQRRRILVYGGLCVSNGRVLLRFYPIIKRQLFQEAFKRIACKTTDKSGFISQGNGNGWLNMINM